MKKPAIKYTCTTSQIRAMASIIKDRHSCCGAAFLAVIGSTVYTLDAQDTRFSHEESIARKLELICFLLKRAENRNFLHAITADHGIAHGHQKAFATALGHIGFEAVGRSTNANSGKKLTMWLSRPHLRWHYMPKSALDRVGPDFERSGYSIPDASVKIP
jgi:hypothetical protein